MQVAAPRVFYLFVYGALLFVGDSWADDLLVRESAPLPPEQERKALRVPNGFEIQLFASEPMINKPINIGFDGEGRLWVSSTVEYPYAAERDRWNDEKGSFVRDSRDAIKILEDTDGDGKADKVTDFADRLNIPTGVLPWHKPEHQLGCIAWSIPNIWYFADTTGDGKCDLREVLFGPLGYEKDTHGMCSSFRMGKDGWVYATHGFNNTSHLVAKDGSTLDLHSGNVFRFRPDGSSVEIWSRGQVNPFGLCFDRRGNLYSADCHSAPIYQLLRGATYPSFGKPHHGLGFGPTMIEHSHGSTGIAGIAYLDRNRWGEAWNDHILIGNPVSSRVNMDRIEFDGSTPHAVERPDFIVSDDPWFRPVDLALGPDRALYIADFYNRIIGHYEVPLEHPGRDRERGRIWRVTKSQMPKGETSEEPFYIKVSIDPLLSSDPPTPFGLRKFASTLYESPRIPAIPVTLEVLASTPETDTHLRHALKLALRECLELPDAFSSLEATNPDLASIALAVFSEEAAAYLLNFDTGDRKDSAVGFDRSRLVHIASHGSQATVEKLILDEKTRAVSPSTAAASLAAIVEGVEERGLHPNREALVDWAQDLARTLLRKREQNGIGTWNTILTGDSDSPWTMQTRPCADGTEARVLSSLRKGEKRAEQRTGVLRSTPFVAPKQLSFWICGHRGLPDQPAKSENYIRLIGTETGEELARTYPPRSDTCQPITWELGESAGEDVQIEIVDGDKGKSFAWLGVCRIEGAEGISTDSFQEDEASSKHLGLLAKLLMFSAPANLRDQLRPFLPPSPPAPPRDITEEDQNRIDTIIATRIEEYPLKTPDTNNGQLVFQTQCASCHQVDGTGGLIGPQLDGIGSRGLERLAEDILDPNKNVDAHFRLTTLTMNDGSVTGGFVSAERGEVIQLIDATGKHHRIPKNQIAKRETSSLSLMPGHFGTLLTPDDTRDLLGWLLR